MFGRGLTQEDGSLASPGRDKSRGRRNRRSTRKQRNKSKKRADDSAASTQRGGGGGGDTAKLDAFFLTEESDAELPSSYATAAAASDQYATDAHSGQRAIAAARRHHDEVRRALMFDTGGETDDQTSDYSDVPGGGRGSAHRSSSAKAATSRTAKRARSYNHTSSSSDGDDESSGECDVPDDTPSRQQKRPRRENASHSEKRGGKRFGMPTESIDIAAQSGFPAPSLCPSGTSGSQRGVSSAPSEMRQIQRSVRRANTIAPQQLTTANAASNVSEITVENEIDNQRIDSCMNAFLITMRENPYYQYATSVAAGLGKRDEMAFIDDRTEQFLAAVMPKNGGKRQALIKRSAQQMRSDASLLRSAAYFLKSHVDADFSAGGQRARTAALDVATNSLDNMRAIQEEHSRVYRALQLARPAVHRRIYLSNTLLSFAGEAMEELYRAGLEQSYTADDLIMHSDRVRSSFAALTAAKMATNQNSTGSVPFVQIQMVANLAKVERHAKDVVRLIKSDSTHSYSIYDGGSAHSGTSPTARFNAPEYNPHLPLPLPGDSSRSISRLLRRRRR